MNTVPSGSADSAAYVDISIVAIARLIRDRKFTFILVFLSIFGGSISYAFLATPVYRAEVIVSPVSGGLRAGGGLGRALQGFGSVGMLLGGGGTAAGRNARAVGMSALTSPFFTRAFIEDQGLLPILFSEKWDSQNGEWNVSNPQDIPTLSDGYQLFTAEVLEVNDDDQSGLVTIAIKWKDPVLAAELANSLVATVNERLRAQAIQEADLTINVLNDELAQTSAVELQQALYAMIEGEIEKRTVARVQKDYSFNILSPAIPADLDKFEAPNRPFIIAAGFLMGFFGALFVVALIGPLGQLMRELKGSTT